MPEEVSKTSIKGLFQDLASKGSAEVVQAIVKEESPLRVQVVNDEKLILTEDLLFIPEHLKDYQTEITLLEWKTENQSGGSGEASFSSHNHDIIGKKKIIVHNAMKKNDVIYLLSYAKGKQYFVLGRVSRGGE